MTPSFAVKGGARYRYDISRAAAEGRQAEAGSVSRVLAIDVERAVLEAIATISHAETDADAIREGVERVTIQAAVISIALTPQAADIGGVHTIVANWTKPSFRVRREIIPPAEGQLDDPRAMTFDTRARILTAIGNARRWIGDLTSGRMIDIETLAVRENRSARSVSTFLSLAFLAPDLVKAIVENRMPRGIGLTLMTDLPSEWRFQWRALWLPVDPNERDPSRC